MKEVEDRQWKLADDLTAGGTIGWCSVIGFFSTSVPPLHGADHPPDLAQAYNRVVAPISGVRLSN